MQCFVIARCCVFVFFCVLLYGIAWFLCFIVCYCMAYQSVVLCFFMLLRGIVCFCMLQHGIVFYVIACYCKLLYIRYCICCVLCYIMLLCVIVFFVFYDVSCYCVATVCRLSAPTKYSIENRPNPVCPEQLQIQSLNTLLGPERVNLYQF